MAIRFGDFDFEPRTLVLTRRGRRVSLRPKTAVLLKVLVQQPNQIVSKSQLAERVWGGRLVSEQSLFQAISELRAVLGDEPMIITHPNRGYCFVPPAPQRSAATLRLAASALLCVGLAGDIVRQAAVVPSGQPAMHAEHPFVAPAIRALVSGVALLDAGQPVQASKHFEFALKEDPALATAGALLAESWLAQGRAEEARALAGSLLGDLQTADSAAVSAMAVLSRISERAGQHQSSVDWAVSADAAARQSPMACAALATKQRLERLLQHPISPPASPLLPDTVEPAQTMATLASVESCRPWLTPPPGDDLGLCLPHTDPTRVGRARFA